MKYTGTADIYVTERCNMNCLFCSARKEGKDVEISDFYRYVDTWVEYGVTHINITGGEPLLHPQINQLLKYASDRGMEVALFTNAKLIENVDLNSILPNVQWLAVSIDGNNTDNAFLGRGNNQMTRTIQTLKLVKSIKPDILIRVASIVTKQNQKGLFELGSALIENEIIPDLWRIKQLIPVRRAVENWDLLSVTDEYYENITRELKNSFSDIINIRSNGWKSKSGDLIVTYPDGESGVTIIPEKGGVGNVVNLGNIFSEFDEVLKNWKSAVQYDSWAADNYKEEAWGLNKTT